MSQLSLPMALSFFAAHIYLFSFLSFHNAHSCAPSLIQCCFFLFKARNVHVSLLFLTNYLHLL